MNKLQKLATKLNECFEYKTFDKGTDKERTIVTIKDESVIGKDLHDICIRLVYGNNKAGDNYTYQWTWTALDIIANAKDEDEIQDLFNEQEASIYTHDLTAWLHSRCDRVYYITQAINEYDSKDGFQVLSTAQYCEMREVFEDVLSQLINIKDGK
jgi:hypothetical protein